VNGVAFTIKAPLGRVVWSSGTGRGSFVPASGSEVVVHPSAALELMAAVGSDGFVLLLALATLAHPDQENRLAVTGGAERVGDLLGWGRDKSQRVFRALAAAGFVLREQGRVTTGKARFAPTKLILDPGLYQPVADPPAASGTPPPAPAVTDQSTTGGHAPQGAMFGAAESGSEDVSAGGIAGRFSGGGVSEDEDSPPGSTAAAESGSEDVSAGGIAGRFSGPGRPRVMNDVDDAGNDFPSSSQRSADQPADGSSPADASWAETPPDEPPLGGDDRYDPSAAAVLAALVALGFSDAREVLLNTDPTVMRNSLEYLLANIESIERPGAYLRQLLRSGGPPSGGDLVGRLTAALQTTPLPNGPQPASAPFPPHPPSLLRASSVPENVAPGGDPKGGGDSEVLSPVEVESYLESLEVELREQLLRDADKAATALENGLRNKGLRLPPAAAAAARHQALVEQLTRLKSEGVLKTDAEPSPAKATGAVSMTTGDAGLPGTPEVTAEPF
jgi:hypothetical protein